ncbi:MAG: hypothetical protein JWQ76_1885 [Ramlibacter sp.]|nr:hypothetical protein [Ramlibacter sp.]
MKRRFLLTRSGVTLAVATLGLAAPLVSLSQPTASRVITLVVPQAPGGSNDAFARALGARLPKVLDANVVVENRPGANGNVGSAWVAKSAPKDGSVWLVTVNSTLTINPFLYSKPGFDTTTDFLPVGGIAVVPHVLLARADLPVNNLAELLQQARNNPGKYSYGSSGNGTFSHLLMEQLKQSQKVDLVHVPYKGVAPALTDLMAGEIQYAISTLPAAMPFIKSGHLKPLAVTSLARPNALPNVPLANDTVPGMVGELWIALYAPKGTPPALVSQMHAAMGKVLAMPDMQAMMGAQGATPFLAGPAELQAMTAAELERWGPVVKASGMRID